MKFSSVQTTNKLVRTRKWLRENWQIVLFWIACAFAGWYLGSRGLGLVLYFHLIGITPEEWSPITLLTAQKDPKVGNPVSLDGLVDWHGKPLKLPFPDKMTGLIFICAHCGMEERLTIFHDFQNLHADKIRMVVVYIGQSSEELLWFKENFKDLIWARDPKLSVFERLNALYMPRFYLIAPDGTLRYLSPLGSYLWFAERWQQELGHIEKLLGR